MYLVIGDENDISRFTEEELKEFLSCFSGNIRIYRIDGIKYPPQEVLWNWHRKYLVDIYGNVIFNY